MKITVKLFASLTEFLPPGARGHAVDMEVAEGATPSTVIQRLGVPTEMAHLVMIDGVFVPPGDRSSRRLEEGEQLAIFPPVAGG